jgi:WD40 repeat protein
MAVAPAQRRDASLCLIVLSRIGTYAILVTGPRLVSSLSLLLLLAATACDSNEGPDEVADVSLVPASTTLVIGDSVQLTPTARASDGRVLSLDNRTTEWTTTNPDVATVSGSGMVTALSVGTVVIHATIEGHDGEADIAVTETPVPPPAGLRIISGDGQQATVTDTMPSPLVVQLVDQNGAARPGVVVTFLAATDTADLTSNFVTTDADGFASTVVVLKTNAGPFTVSVTVAGESGVATIALRALADAPVLAFVEDGDQQIGFAGQALPDPVVVELDDQFGNRVPGVSVQWVVTAGGGAPASPTTVSDDSGRASVSWMMGAAPGADTLEARVGGLAPARFSALAITTGSGRITFTRGEGPPGSLLMHMNSDGTGVATLPGSVPGDFDSDWSHDGSRIVFANFAANPSRISGFNSFADIMVMNANGTGRTRLTDHFGSVSGPVWSPDGSKIAFASDESGQSEVYVMNAEGSNIVQLSHSGGYAPSWSPNGARIAVGVRVTGSFSDPPASVIDADDGGNVVPLIPGEDPAWSPDGSRIALAVCGSSCDLDDYKISLVHPDGTGVTTEQTLTGLHEPVWSRDGSRLAARLVTLGERASQIWTLNPDGSGYNQLTGPADHLPSWGP